MKTRNDRLNPRHRITAAALSLAALGFTAYSVAPALGQNNTPPAYVASALAWWERPPLEFRHDAALKTADVVTFAGVKPGMKVVDIFPGGGYYTRIFSRIVGKDGMVYAVVPREQSHEGPKVTPYGIGLQNAGPGPLNRLER